MNTQRIAASLEKKFNEQVGHRPDMVLADARRINESTANFLIEYEGKAPTARDVGEFFSKSFDGELTPFISTARVYPSKKSLMIIAQVMTLTREITETKRDNMKTVIANTLYYDAPLQEMWEVKQIQGKKMLVRKNKEDIMAMVSARRNNLGPRKTFASFNRADDVEVGDILKIFNVNDGKVIMARVVKANSEEVVVRHKGQAIAVGQDQVLEVRKKSKYQNLEDYYADAYGDREYAKKLVKNNKA